MEGGQLVLGILREFGECYDGNGISIAGTKLFMAEIFVIPFKQREKRSTPFFRIVTDASDPLFAIKDQDD